MDLQNTATGRLVDRAGELKALAAAVAAELDEIKAILRNRHGEGSVEGEAFRASLSHSLKSTTDWRAVAAHFASLAGASERQFDAAVAERTSCADAWVMRVNARVTKR